MPSFGDPRGGYNTPYTFDSALEDASVSSRLRAEEFRAEDLDGILEGVSGSGNLNFAVLQAGLAGGGAFADEGMYAGFDGVGIGAADGAGLGRQMLGDAAQSYSAVLPAAPSFSSMSAYNGAQTGPLFINDFAGPRALQSAFGTANGSSFSAQFSVAPIGAAITDLEAPPAPPVVSGPGLAPGGDDGPDPAAPPQQPPHAGGGDPPPNNGGDGDPGDPPSGPDGDQPGIDEVIDIVTDAVVPVVDPVLDLVDGVAETIDSVLEGLPLEPVADLAGDVIDGVTDALDPVTDIVDGLQDALLGSAEQIVSGLLTEVSNLGDSLLGDTLLGDVTDALPGLADIVNLPPLGGAVNDALTGVVDLVDTLTTGGLGETVGGLTGAVSDLLDGGLGDYLDGVLKDPSSLADGLDGILDTVSAPLGGFPGGGVVDHVLTVVDNTLDTALSGELGDLLGGVTNGLNDLSGGAGTDLLENGPLGGVVDAVTDVGEGVGGGLDEILGGAEDILDDVAGGITDPLDGVTEGGGEIVEDILGGAGDAVDTITDGLGDAIDTITDPVESVLGGDGSGGGLEDVVDTATGAIDDLLGGDGGGGVLDGLLPGGGDPLIEIDSALSLNGDGATGDTAADGEGTLIDIDTVTPVDIDTIAGAGDIGDILDGAETEISLGGADPIDPADIAGDIIDGADETLDTLGGEDSLLDGVDVGGLLSPLGETVDAALDLLDGQEAETDLSLDISDTGEIAGELIGDIVISDGDGLLPDLGGGFDLPDPDAVLSEGLPLVDEGLGGLGGGLGGLFG